MSTSSPHVVLGATGGAGRVVVHELVERDLPVRAVSRTGDRGFPVDVDVVAADCQDPEQARKACTGAAAVYQCMNVPYDQWTEVLLALTENAINGAAHADAPLIVTDNLYM